MVDDILRGRAPRINDRFSYNDGVKDVPAYLLQPQSLDKTNYEVLVRDGYYTAEELT
jgi:putative multiple sugar transport system substrate-binding protein